MSDPSPLPNTSLSSFALQPLVVALACGGAVGAAHANTAPDTADEQQVRTLETVEATGSRIPDSASPKFTVALVNTPKSVTVIPQDIIQQRGVTSLLDVLRTTPGITLGSGEGGTPMGDRPFIRGYEASTDMMIDGVRDLGRFAHESFNIEQVEVAKGPGSAYSGRGSTGGSINMVSKKPLNEERASASIGLGSDAYRRVTLDNNYLISPNIALRLNAMAHEAQPPGRDIKSAERWGLAPSITFGLNNAFQATLSYYLLRQDDMPDQGHPMDPVTNQPVKVRRGNFYGVWGRDERRNDADTGTLELNYTFDNGITIRNLTRRGETISQYIFSRPTIHIPTGLVNRASRTGNRRSRTLANQTDVHGQLATGPITHNFAAGLEFSREELHTGATVPAGASIDVDRTDLHNPTPWDPYTGPGIKSFSRDYNNLTNKTNTRAAYLFDTLEFSPQWLANLGMRFDDYDVRGGNAATSPRNHSTMFNYQVGLVFKPADNGSIYTSFATSSNPSGETQGQSGGADGAPGGGLGGTRPNLDPEKNRSVELGTKWDLFDDQLALTAAVFRTEKTNQRAVDPGTGDIALIGNNRTRGFELGVSGNVTEQWSVFGGYTWLDPKMIDAGRNEQLNGRLLKFIAKHSFSVWSTYQITDDFSFGGGAYYMSGRFMNDANTISVPSYWRFDLMASYRVNPKLDLNVNNLTDEIIYEGSHVGIFANVGPGRLTMLTANFRF